MGRAKHCTVEERWLVGNLRKQKKNRTNFTLNHLDSTNTIFCCKIPKTSTEWRGGKKKTTYTIDNLIVTRTTGDYFKPYKAIAAGISNVVNISGSYEEPIIQHEANRQNSSKVLPLKQSNLRKRKSFAQKHKSWCRPEDTKKWYNTLWSDETKINLFGDNAGWNVRWSKEQEFSPQFQKNT